MNVTTGRLPLPFSGFDRNYDVLTPGSSTGMKRPSPLAFSRSPTRYRRRPTTPSSPPLHPSGAGGAPLGHDEYLFHEYGPPPPPFARGGARSAFDHMRPDSPTWLETTPVPGSHSPLAAPHGEPLLLLTAGSCSRTDTAEGVVINILVPMLDAAASSGLSQAQLDMDFAAGDPRVQHPVAGLEFAEMQGRTDRLKAELAGPLHLPQAMRDVPATRAKISPELVGRLVEILLDWSFFACQFSTMAATKYSAWMREESVHRTIRYWQGFAGEAAHTCSAADFARRVDEFHHMLMTATDMLIEKVTKAHSKGARRPLTPAFVRSRVYAPVTLSASEASRDPHTRRVDRLVHSVDRRQHQGQDFSPAHPHSAFQGHRQPSRFAPQRPQPPPMDPSRARDAFQGNRVPPPPPQAQAGHQVRDRLFAALRTMRADEAGPGSAAAREVAQFLCYKHFTHGNQPGLGCTAHFCRRGHTSFDEIQHAAGPEVAKAVADIVRAGPPAPPPRG